MFGARVCVHVELSGRVMCRNLSMNRLESVSGGARGSALQRLWLDRCGLRRLPAHALRDLDHLHYL